MVIEEEEWNRVSIKPVLSNNVKNLVEIIRDFEGVELLRIEFECTSKGEGISRKGYGKEEKVKVEFTESSMRIPKQTHKITPNYTIHDLLFAFRDIESEILEKDNTFTFDGIYPNSLMIFDKGSAPNFAEHIVVFNKVRKINPKSDVGKILNTIHMPIDLIEVSKAKLREKFDVGENRDRISYKRAGKIRDIDDSEIEFIDADDVKKYTRNIYDSEFTDKTSCIVGVETKETKKVVPIEGGSCKIVPKYKYDENANKENNKKAEE